MSKTREIVLGIHDPAPPEGRVTLELLDERGLKVLHRERANNAIMTHQTNMMKHRVRGRQKSNASDVYGGYNFHNQTLDSSFGTWTEEGEHPIIQGWWASAKAGHPELRTPEAEAALYGYIILSDSTETVNADEFMFPGNVNAFVDLTVGVAPGTNLKRTGLTLANCQRTSSLLRYEAEWGTGYGNGVHNSIGIGSVEWSTGQYASVRAPYFYTATGVGQWFGNRSLGAGSSGTYGYSAHRVDNSEIWILPSMVNASYQLYKLDITGLTAFSPFGQTPSSAANGLSVAGPTLTTIGAGTNQAGVAVIGSDLWLAYGTTLKRCVKPTNTTLSVTNSYTPAGVGACIDICTDGTWIYWLDTTKVWKINATTGVVDSSWLHGLNASDIFTGLVWTNNPVPRLLISRKALTSLGTMTNGKVSSASLTFPTISTAHDISTGAQTAHISSSLSFSSNGQTLTQGGYLFPLDNAHRNWVGWPSNYYFSSYATELTFTPTTHNSRTVLGAPITKTSANSMRVVYEFGF